METFSWVCCLSWLKTEFPSWKTLIVEEHGWYRRDIMFCRIFKIPYHLRHCVLSVTYLYFLYTEKYLICMLLLYYNHIVNSCKKRRNDYDSYLQIHIEVRCFCTVHLNHEWILYLWETLIHPRAGGCYLPDSHSSLSAEGTHGCVPCRHE